MTISHDLFTALLAMDSYNRGYNAGVNLGEGTALGSASIITASDEVISKPPAFSPSPIPTTAKPSSPIAARTPFWAMTLPAGATSSMAG